MNKSDRIILGFLFGFIILIGSFCLGWWSFYLMKANAVIGIILGLVIGLIINYMYIFKIIEKAFNFNYRLLAILYSIYAIGIFGFFMGMPVFNILLGPISGWYIGRRLKINNYDLKSFERVLNKVNLFGLIILIFICVASAFIALRDPWTAANLKGMFNLSFDVTNAMIIGIIGIGGISLILIQYFSTKITAHFIYNKI